MWSGQLFAGQLNTGLFDLLKFLLPYHSRISQSLSNGYLAPLSSHAFFPPPPLYFLIPFSGFSAFTISWFSSQRLNVNPFGFSQLYYYLKLIFISTTNKRKFLISHQMCFQASIYTLVFLAGIVHAFLKITYLNKKTEQCVTLISYPIN